MSDNFLGNFLLAHQARDFGVLSLFFAIVAIRQSADMELPSYRKQHDPLWYQEDYDIGDDELGDMDFSRENVDTILRDKYFRNSAKTMRNATAKTTGVVFAHQCRIHVGEARTDF